MRRIHLLLCSVALAWSVALPLRAAAGVQQLQYAGQLIQRDAQGTGVPVRSYRLHAWIDRAGNAQQVNSRVDDEDRGGLAWFERFSRQVRDAEGTLAGPLPRLQHVHDQRPHQLTLPSPLFAHPGELAEGVEWESEWEGRRVQFEVVGTERAQGRDCWKVEVGGNPGRRQTLLVEKATDLLVSANLRVFIGQGERFDLMLTLEEERLLSPDEAAAVLKVIDLLTALQTELRLQESPSHQGLSPAQVARVESALPELRQSSAGTAWEKFAQTVEADVTTDRQRSESLGKLAARYLGKVAPAFTLVGTDGAAIVRTQDEGRIVVLHFWDYRGTPEAPFGQVGYLDFLAGKVGGDGVRVYGIAVDDRAADPKQVAAVRRAVRQFTNQFIKVGYPVAIDDGSLLATFGDPRPIGVTLPLWVVIGRDGTVIHHKAGLYGIDPNRGLEELEAVISRARKP